MIRATITNNTDRKRELFDENTTTLREAFESVGMDYHAKQIILEGVMIRPGDIDKTFAEVGVVSETPILCAMDKTDNATK